MSLIMIYLINFFNIFMHLLVWEVRFVNFRQLPYLPKISALISHLICNLCGHRVIVLLVVEMIIINFNLLSIGLKQIGWKTSDVLWHFDCSLVPGIDEIYSIATIIWSLCHLTLTWLHQINFIMVCVGSATSGLAITRITRLGNDC